MADRRPHDSAAEPAGGDMSSRVAAAVSSVPGGSQSSAAQSSAAQSSGTARHPGPTPTPARGRGLGKAKRGGDKPAKAGKPAKTAAASSGATATPKSAPPAARPRGTRRARLRLVHLDPWSVMKTAFLLSIALGIVLVVAVAVVWSVLSAAGVWDSINKTVGDVLGGDSAQNFDVQNYVGTSRVLGFTMIVAVVDVVLITAISTLAAFLYNLAAALLGGIEVTLAEDER